MRKVGIITPNYKREFKTVVKCINSVNKQTYKQWEHVICTDGEEDTSISAYVKSANEQRRIYKWLPENTGKFGDFVRQRMIAESTCDYLCFLDDDNILFPLYLEKMVQVLDANPEVAMVISQALHFGPFPDSYGEPPIVLEGYPKPGHIDTIQVMVRTKVIQKIQWRSKRADGYFSDGYTYEAIAEKHKWVSIPDVLSVHF
jgi:glycosyltransferase involved in cell wall biosynthesis